MDPDTIILHKRPDGTIYMFAGWATLVEVSAEPTYIDVSWDDPRQHSRILAEDRVTARVDMVVMQTIQDVRDVADVWRKMNEPKSLPAPRLEA